VAPRSISSLMTSSMTVSPVLRNGSGDPKAGSRTAGAQPIRCTRIPVSTAAATESRKASSFGACPSKSR